VREVKLARQLNHPGIVKIYDAQKWQNTLFYTMEYLQGKSLRRWLQQRQRLDFGPTVRVLCLVASALDHAHRITIHRDLSPENIMVLPDGSVRLFDFGLAKLDDEFKNLTTAGANLGKLKYMAPEQELNASEVDHRADLYSLGVIFFEMLTGNVPMPGQRITDLRPDLPPEADLFLVKALALEPDNRFSSAREFHAALLQLYKLHKAHEEGAAVSGTPLPAAVPESTAPRGIFSRTKSFLRRLLRRESG
jgi:serine/threonine-protein kinase